MTLSPLDPSTTTAVHDIYVFDEYGLAHPLMCRYATLGLPNPNDHDGSMRPCGDIAEEGVRNALKDLAEYRLSYPQYRFKAVVRVVTFTADYEFNVDQAIDTDDLEAIGNLLMEEEVPRDIAA